MNPKGAVSARAKESRPYRLMYGRYVQGLGTPETALLTGMGGQPTRVDPLILSRVEYPALERLIALGLVIPTGVTPTDAAHVLGLQATFDSALATKALQEMGFSNVTSADMRFADWVKAGYPVTKPTN